MTANGKTYNHALDQCSEFSPLPSPKVTHTQYLIEYLTEYHTSYSNNTHNEILCLQNIQDQTGTCTVCLNKLYVNRLQYL